MALLLSTVSFLRGQNHFSKYEIGDSGCSAYFFTQPAPAEMSLSEDQSKVYIMESTDEQGNTYSTITVKLSESIDAGSSEELLISYMEYLKSSLNVIQSQGYVHGLQLTTHPAAAGIKDYWSDAESNGTVVGYVDTNFLVVMFVWQVENDPDIISKSDAFFKGFRFPGDSN